MVKTLNMINCWIVQTDQTRQLIWLLGKFLASSHRRVVMMCAFHAEVPGSIPGKKTFFYFFVLFFDVLSQNRCKWVWKTKQTKNLSSEFSRTHTEKTLCCSFLAIATKPIRLLSCVAHHSKAETMGCKSWSSYHTKDLHIAENLLANLSSVHLYIYNLTKDDLTRESTPWINVWSQINLANFLVRLGLYGSVRFIFRNS